MDINKFEERIKSTFGQHRPAADTDAIWENIEPQLRKKKKRRAIIWFFGLLGLGLLFLFFQNHESARIASVVATNNSPASPATAAQGGGAKPPFQEKSVLTASDQAAPAEAQEVAAGERLMPRAVAVAASANDNSNEKPGKTAMSVSKEADLNHTIMVADHTAPVTAARAGVLLPLAMLDWKRMQHDSVPDTSILQLGRSAKARSQVNRDEKEEDLADNEPEDEKKPKRRKKWKWQKLQWEHSMGLQAGPALAIKRLRERDGATAPVGLLNNRKSTEHTMESYTVSMFYTAAVRQGLMLKTGLNYRQSNEKFHLGYHKQEVEQINGVLTVTVNNAGTPIGQTTGLKDVIKTTEYSNTAYNHYRFVNLPLGIGYRHTGRKNHWELSGGVDLNLFFRAAGTMYNRYNVLSTFGHGTPSYENVFRKSTGLGLWAGYAYDWRITDQLRWQLSANAQMPLHSVSSADYALVQRYFNVGIQVGVVCAVQKTTKRK